MATYTTNINLKKPTTSEMYNVLDWNDNSDKIDAAIANKIIVVRYSASLEANQYVTAPFTHYAEITLDTSKGTPICARINGSSTKAKVASFTAGSGKCFVQGIGAEDITVDITYIKNPATT